MCEHGEFQERYRRMRKIVEEHPHLSGLMERETMGSLDMMLHYAADHGVERTLQSVHFATGDPNWELEIGFDEIVEVTE